VFFLSQISSVSFGTANLLYCHMNNDDMNDDDINMLIWLVYHIQGLFLVFIFSILNKRSQMLNDFLLKMLRDIFKFNGFK
jgi:hypothetical protein